jgi:hypothetical protein
MPRLLNITDTTLREAIRAWISAQIGQYDTDDDAFGDLLEMVEEWTNEWLEDRRKR